MKLFPDIKIMIMMLPFSTLIFMLNHPLSMGFNILIITIMISMITGMMNSTYWFSYILFLVMIGGMLILFMYMTSIASNEKFKFSYKIIITSISMIFMSTFFIWNNEKINFNYKTQEISQLFMKTNNMIMNLKYFSNPMTTLLICSLIYLLITMIMIVKITKKEKGPIRQK
uniref:NADH-ubiquinone oxidoreductase chain 6 n=1 Tax=Trichochrysea japana TaxID=3073295 RepID=A0AA51NNU7_9CUCU|nr:NADH dehydrogenase subunit 6 [Trichochrysea japana]WMQ75987.1 NADH dehydrogenase subunit 6 [Trichochrysea japana]